MKKVICFILSIVLVLTTTVSCRHNDTKQSTEIESETEKITLRIVISLTEIDGVNEDLNVSLAGFLEEHPNVEIVVEDGNMLQQANIASGNGPDLIRVSRESLPQYVNSGTIIPLDDYLASSEYYNPDDLFEAAMTSFTYNGTEFGKGNIYGLAKDWAPYCLHINKSLLEAENIPIPTLENPWTYSEAEEYYHRLTKKTVEDSTSIDVFGYYSETSGEVSLIEAMLNQIDKSIFSPDFATVNLQDEDIVKILKHRYERAKSGVQASIKFRMEDPLIAFVTGKLAVFETAMWRCRGYVNNENRAVALEDIVLAPLPVPDGTDTVQVSCNPVGYAIYSESEHPDLAFELLEYICLREPAQTRATVGSNLPIQISVAENTEIKDPFVNAAKDFTFELSKQEFYDERCNPYVSANALTSAFLKYLIPAIYDEISFEMMVHLIEDEIQSLIDLGMKENETGEARNDI